jgi:hypothetical protein
MTAPTLTAGNVRVGVSGEVSCGPTTAAAPTTASSALTGFHGLGYLDEKGLGRKPEAKKKDIVAWQNSKVVRSVQDGAAKVTYTFNLIETSKETVEFAYGTTVAQTVTEGTYSADPASTGGIQSFVFDVIDGGNLRREYVEEGEMTDPPETTFANGEPSGFACTVVAYTVPIVMDTSLKMP